MLFRSYTLHFTKPHCVIANMRMLHKSGVHEGKPSDVFHGKSFSTLFDQKQHTIRLIVTAADNPATTEHHCISDWPQGTVCVLQDKIQ